MHRAGSNLSWSALVILALWTTGCEALSGSEEPPGRPRSSRLTFADEWSAAIYDMGRFPVFPPTEDVYVGDVYAFSTPPNFGSVESADGLRTAATPRWKSLNVLPLLEEEYRQRPEWTRSAGAGSPDVPGGAKQSLYGADHVAARHRIAGVRSMLKVTLTLPDLEPFIPIEIAPLIKGPATPERFAVSVQAGDAESYSLSVDTLLEQLLDFTQEPDGPTFSLKPEHLRNLPLAADPITGKAYLVVLTEVLYIRSIEASIRRREEPLVDDSTDSDPEPVEPATTEPVEPPKTDPEESNAEDPGVAAILRAQAMNAAASESNLEDQGGGTIQIVMATDDALTLRRSWPYPLAVAVRGITLEVDVSTGIVPRMGPLGVALPALPPPPPPPPPPPEPVPEPDPDAAPSETQPDEGAEASSPR